MPATGFPDQVMIDPTEAEKWLRTNWRRISNLSDDPDYTMGPDGKRVYRQWDGSFTNRYDARKATVTYPNLQAVRDARELAWGVEPSFANVPDGGSSKTASGAVDFSVSPEWHDVFYNEPRPERVKELSEFLGDDPNRFIRLYHGTAAKIPVMEEGLKPTSATRRNSMQSGSGYVYLSVYPGMAGDFARMAFPGQKTTVYAVEVTARRLLADKDQLSNQRMYAERKVGDSLAESLAYGHGARVKGTIDPFQIQPLSTS